MGAIASGKQPRRAGSALAFASFLIGLCASSAMALSPSKSITQFAMDSWQTEAGLPELAMDAILETSDGYLWLGTQEGLARFDGAHFTVFDRHNTPALRSDFITRLVEDRQHSLWIGTSIGLVVRHADGRFDTFGAEHGLQITHVYAEVLDTDGSVWVGGAGGLAHIVDGKVAGTFDERNGLTNNLVTSLVIDREGALWVIARRHLHRIKNGNVENFTEADGIKGHSVNRLFKSREGELWVLSSGTGIIRRVDGRFEVWWPEGVPPVNVSDVLEDRDGNVWLASDANGLFRSWQHLLNKTSAEQGLNDLGLLTLFEDSSGNLWIGTLGRGLIRLRDGSFTAFTKKEGLSADTAFSVMQDRAGDIWAGTLDGLTRFSIDEVRHFSKADGLSNNYITSMGDDPDGGIWVGLGGTMIDHIRAGKIDRKISLKTPLLSGITTSVIEDKQHRLWAGTDGGGLARCTVNANGPDEIRYFTAGDGLPDNFVSALAEDAGGDLWIGTGAGLGRLRGDTIDPDPLHDAELRQTGILSLYIDAKGTLWIGTARGLLRYEQGRVARYTRREGLPNETINSILTDGNDNVWLGSNRGIFRIGRRDLDEVAAGRAGKLRVERFGEANGMKSAETSAGEQPTAWRSNDGRLWFATVQGVVVVDPNRPQPAQPPLRTIVESVSANDAIVALSDGRAQLPAGTSRLEIGYTAPDLTDAETMHFRYRLQNVDADWIDVGGERVARYTNVPPGTHRFEVQARRDNEEWGASAAAAIAFDVAPLFYQTWWFVIACVLAAVAMLSIFHHLRVKWLHMQSAVADERRRIAGEIHDSLAQGFSAISVQIEAALGRLDRAPDLAASHLKLARDVSRTSLSEARRSVWNLQSPSQESNLIGAIAAACEQIAYGQGVSLHTKASGNAWPVNPAAENNLLRIAQEAVSNAIHHGAPGEIHIETMYTFSHLTLSVTDDGCGFDVTAGSCQPDRGFGLANMQRRAEAMNGRFEATSAAGVGTRIAVTIPRIALLNRIWREFRTAAPARLR